MSPQNFGRLPIIEDTTRSYHVVLNPMGDDEPGAGWYCAEHCPVNGKQLIAGPFLEKAAAEQWLAMII